MIDLSTLRELQDLLLLQGYSGKDSMHDASVLSCGCLVSEEHFLANESVLCPSCSEHGVNLLKPIWPLRQLHGIVERLKHELGFETNAKSSFLGLGSVPTAAPKPPTRMLSQSAQVLHTLQPELDLVGLFCKFAREEQEEEHGKSNVLKSVTDEKASSKASNLNTWARESDKVINFKYIPEKAQQAHSNLLTGMLDERVLLGLGENEERNFSQCFPFHRKISTFATQQGKSPFSSRSLMKKISPFTGSAIFTRFDLKTKSEITLFVLISDRKWELYHYNASKPVLLACGRLTGEFGPSSSTLAAPKSEGLIVLNDFAGKKPELAKQSKESDLRHRLKSWVQLYCCLSDKYLVILGTKGIIRVLNVDPSSGEIGEPVYTYLIDFPIRCISLALSNDLLACGITSKEKMTGKSQPFVIVHHINDKAQVNSQGRSVLVTPITITVPYRDPLKKMTFNSSSTHLLCCTVYEMRYFIIRLRQNRDSDFKRPRLVFTDTRLAKNQRGGRFPQNEEGLDNLANLLGTEDDDQMLDNEGITDIKFGQPFTNTIIITSSSLKDKPSVVLKIKGPAFDSRQLDWRPAKVDSCTESIVNLDPDSFEDEESTTETELEELLKLHEIGSNIYGTAVSPRGDSLVFVDKQGRLLLVAMKDDQRKFSGLLQLGTVVVLLGEVSPALRHTESASVCFSSDGGKVMAIDRKGSFQVFDFTKGIPGEDLEVIKCKIISVR